MYKKKAFSPSILKANYYVLTAYQSVCALFWKY